MAEFRYDVAVVGAGTSGAVAAREAAKTGARTVLLDQHPPSQGRTVCAGLVSPRTLEILGVGSDVVLRSIRGATVHGPEGVDLHLRSDDVKGVVVDRSAVREQLLAAVEAAGADLRAPAHVTSAARGRLQVEGSDGPYAIEAAVIVGAEGPRSVTAHGFGLPAPDPILPSIQVTVPAVPARDDEVEIFLGTAVAPGFFAWAVPAEPDRIRVGLACLPSASPTALLTHLLEARFPDLAPQEHEPAVALLPLGPTASTTADGALLVGDAAGQVKPLSGGGICTGARCASLGGRLAGWAALAGTTQRDSLEIYDRRWRQEIGHEMSFGQEIHRMRCALTDEQLAAAMRAADHRALLDLVADKADIDRPSTLLDAFLGRQDLWPRLLGIATAVGNWPRLTDLLREAVRLVRPRNL
jgi:geranylgeranyl reductase family protein